MTQPNMYPLYELYDADGRQRVRCSYKSMAEQYHAKHGWTIRLEARDLDHEAALPAERRAEIDAIYAAGVA